MKFDQPAVDRLISAISVRNDVVPFVGAGISMQVDLPGWSEFLISQANTLDLLDRVKINLCEGKYEEAAEAIFDDRGAAFIDAIESQFDTSSSSLNLRSAAFCLPRLFQGPVVTTNFDNILELVYDSCGRRFTTIVQGAQGQEVLDAFQSDSHSLIKIHGKASNNETRILTRSEYKFHYCRGRTNRIDYRKVLPLGLRSLMSKATFLFIGWSLKKDRYLSVLATAVRGTLNRHYAIVAEPRSDERVKELRRYNIFPIWYPTGEHQCIRIILEYIASAARIPSLTGFCPSHAMPGERLLCVCLVDMFARDTFDVLMHIHTEMCCGGTLEALKGTAFDFMIPEFIASSERQLLLTREDGEVTLRAFPTLIQNGINPIKYVQLPKAADHLVFEFWPQQKGNHPRFEIAFYGGNEPRLEISTRDARGPCVLEMKLIY